MSLHHFCEGGVSPVCLPLTVWGKWSPIT